MSDVLQPEGLLPTLSPWLDAPQWWLGLSGGVDSTVLLHVLVTLGREQALPPLRALHIDHQLHHDSSVWSAECETLCRDLGVPLDIRRVQVDAQGEGLEAAARQSRYACFESALCQGDLLLLGHHLDDQVETFFLRLMRGAGARGLAGMPASRALGLGTLLRPLLANRRTAILAYARAHGLSWQEDSSNAETDQDRNYLRQSVLPELAARWPEYRSSVQRSQRALLSTERDLLTADFAAIGAARTHESSVLSLAALPTSDPDRVARLLRRWLEESGLASPPADRLLEFSRQLSAAKADRQPRLDGDGYSLRRYRNQLHRIFTVIVPDVSLRLLPGESLVIQGLGELRADVTDAGGLRAPTSGGWSIRWRQGGERCQPQGRAASQSLKKLLQEQGLPPWERDRVPLLYNGDVLAAVAGLWLCEGQLTAPGEPGYSVHWQPAG